VITEEKTSPCRELNTGSPVRTVVLNQLNYRDRTEV
jgi:hypothetical protein